MLLCIHGENGPPPIGPGGDPRFHVTAAVVVRAAEIGRVAARLGAAGNDSERLAVIVARSPGVSLLAAAVEVLEWPPEPPATFAERIRAAGLKALAGRFRAVLATVPKTPGLILPGTGTGPYGDGLGPPLVGAGEIAALGRAASAVAGIVGDRMEGRASASFEAIVGALRIAGAAGVAGLVRLPARGWSGPAIGIAEG